MAQTVNANTLVKPKFLPYDPLGIDYGVSATPELNIPGSYAAPAGVSDINLGYGVAPTIGDGSIAPNVPLAAPTDFFSWDAMAGKQTAEGYAPGWGMPALQTAAALTNTYMGIQKYGLAKQELKENQRQFDMNYGNQRQTMNTEMADRQAARVAANPGFESVESYMQKNGIK